MVTKVATSNGRVIAWCVLAALATGTASVSRASNGADQPFPPVVQTAPSSGVDITAQPLQPHSDAPLVLPVIADSQVGVNTGGSQTKSLEAHVVEEERDRTCSMVNEWTERFHCI